MKIIIKRILPLLLVVIIVSTFKLPVIYAHPGGTDGDGGHYCWTNCSSWGYRTGEYHYHSSVQSIGSPLATAVIVFIASGFYYISFKRSGKNKWLLFDSTNHGISGKLNNKIFQEIKFKISRVEGEIICKNTVVTVGLP